MYKRIGKIIVDKNNLDVVSACVEMGEPVLLVGETGTGKTTLLAEIAKKKKKNLHRVSVNGSTGIEEILGKWLVEKSTTKWQDGILITAMKNGDWIVFDELNSALPEILFSLHSLLDDDKRVMLAEKDSEVIRPHAEFRFFGSMNPSDEYAGTKDMNKAFLSRFNAVLHIDILPPMHEKEAIVKQTGIEDIVAVKLVEIATSLRVLKKRNEIFYFCSTRDLIQAGRLIKSGISEDNALKFSVLNKMTKDEQDISSKSINSVRDIVERDKAKYLTLIQEYEKAGEAVIKVQILESEKMELIRQLESERSEKTKLRSAYDTLSISIADQIKRIAEKSNE